MCGWLPGGKSITQKRVPFGGGGVPTTRAHILDIFADAHVGRILLGDPHQSGAAFGALGVGGGRVDQHLGDVVGVVPGDHAPDRREGFPDFRCHEDQFL
jgi:hypothetical protein